MRFLVSFLLGGTLSGLLGLGLLIGGGTGIFCLGDILCTRLDRLDIPTQIRLSWQDDPARTLSITWQTRGKDNPNSAEFREIGSQTWQQASGIAIAAPRDRLLPGNGWMHRVTLASLRPDTAYEYRVSADLGAKRGWSPVFQTRTAPVSSDAEFSFAFLCDTGIAGRPDGNANGILGVIDAIREIAPTFILGGGDYAYANRDGRFASSNDAIDAWFMQMQPLLARFPFMAQYGNHEILLRETFAQWVGRFAQPSGVDGGRSYAFDVGDIHFTALYAIGYGLPSKVLLDWLERDLAAARAAGAKWLIVFHHEPVYGHGQSHPAVPEFRALVAPIYETHGVDLAINCHDQSYERTFPLTDVPARPTVASRSLTDYEAGSGVIYAKVSPSGKMSERAYDFSRFTTPQQDFMAVRNDTAHHYALITRESSGDLRYKAFRLDPAGGGPSELDGFRIRQRPNLVATGTPRGLNTRIH